MGFKCPLLNTNNGLIDNYINTLIIDKVGNKWIGTINGLSKFSNNSWESFLIGESITALAIDSNGELWVGTLDKLLKPNAH